MGDVFRWGILGPGGIAKKFATGLRALDDAQVVAVGSRSQERADAFADAFEVPRRYASYEALARDPEVDAIYVATPIPFTKNTAFCVWRRASPCCAKSRLPSTNARRET